MIRIGICDDSYDARINLRMGIEGILESRFIEYELFEFTKGERFLKWFSSHIGELDLIFLDIMMGGQNGMEIAKQVRAIDDSIQIAFCTGYTDFVYEGYEVGALGYLLKPAKKDQLDQLLTRALAEMQRQETDIFICKCGEICYRIPKASILYFCSERRQVTCVTKQRNYTFYAKLDEVENEVGEPFVRIHQRYLVRGTAVEHISNATVVIAEQELPISRSYQAEAMMALTRANLA